jgi:hypothetical protein
MTTNPPPGRAKGADRSDRMRLGKTPVKTQSRLERDRRRARARDLEVSRLPEEWQARASAATTKAERVDFVILALRRGVYHRGTTTLACARLWSLSEGAVADVEVEALRAVNRALENDRGELLSELMLRIEALGHGAVDRTEDYVDRFGNLHTIRKPDYRTALAAAVELGVLAGVRREVVQIDVRTLSEEQIVAQLAQHGFQVKQIEATAEPVQEEQHAAGQ